MKNLVRVIIYPDHATSNCPLCDILNLDKTTLAEHFTDEHTKSDSPPWTTLALWPPWTPHVLVMSYVFYINTFQLLLLILYQYNVYFCLLYIVCICHAHAGGHNLTCMKLETPCGRALVHNIIYFSVTQSISLNCMMHHLFFSCCL